jgi:hypothetical protein
MEELRAPEDMLSIKGLRKGAQAVKMAVLSWIVVKR